MKRRLLKVLPLMIIAALISSIAGAETLRIVLVGDLYALGPDKEGRGGYAKLATLLNYSRENYDNVLFLHSGDAFSPSLVASIVKGQQAVRLMNAMALDYMVLGNHEFDFGVEVAAKRFSEARFKLLAANLREADGSPMANVLDSDMIQVGEYKVGIFGLLTPISKQLASMGDLVLNELDPTAQKASKALKEAGADIVLALVHTDMKEDKALIDSGVADAVLSGHDHNLIAFDDGKTQWLESYEDAKKIVVLDINFSKDSKGKLLTDRNMKIYDTIDIEPDPSISQIVAEYDKMLDEMMGAEIGVASSELDSRRAIVRASESSMGNLIADALRAELNTDIAFANGGGIRGNKVYAANTNLTRKDVYTELPFGNVGVKIRVSGAIIREALENGVSDVENGAGRFLQVSGVSYVWSASQPKGQRIKEATVDGQPLDDQKSYTLALNNYMLDGGDGFSMFAGAEVLVDASGGKLIATTVMDYIEKLKQVSVQLEGRITKAD